LADEFDLDLLKSLIAVIGAESVTLAARRLSLTQSTLSKHIGILEARFGCRLFYRDGRGVKPTRAGFVLGERSKWILEKLSTIGDRSPVTDRESPFRISMPPSVAALTMAPLLSVVLGRHPQMNLQVREGLTGQDEELLRNGDLDIAILYSVRDMRGLTVTMNVGDILHLVAPTTGPMGKFTSGAANFDRLDFALPPRANGMRLLVDDLASTLNCECKVKFEVGSLAIITELVRNGLAASFLPWNVIAEDVVSNRMQVFTDLPLRRSLSIVVPSSRLLSPPTMMFSDDLSLTLERQLAQSADDFNFRRSNLRQPFSRVDETAGRLDT
jgi:LysR family transcriptional regulator, nitrogen assimilation regulatory protein